MREISLSKSGEQKLRSHQFELKAQDASDSLRSFTPGEWVRVRNSSLLGFINPMLDEQPGAIQIIENSQHETDPQALIEKKN